MKLVLFSSLLRIPLNFILFCRKYKFFIYILIFNYICYKKNKLKKFIIKKIKNTKYLTKKKKEAVEQIKNNFFKQKKDKSLLTLPTNGLDKSIILTKIEQFKNLTKKTLEEGKISGTVYANNNDLSLLILDSYKKFQYSNPLHSDIFPGLQQMESSIVNMCLSLYNAPSHAIGNITSGGTESIIMACKAYRDKGRELYDIEYPEAVICRSAHVAFNKAAHYLGIKLIIIEDDVYTKKMDIKKLESKLNSNTIFVVGSAPSFPHGVIDPLLEIGNIIDKYNQKNKNKIGFHVDACLGGFIVPFKEKLENTNYHADFRNKNITSISIDTHKYGYSPKGTSVILYKTKELAHYQYMVEANWPGGIYISPNIAGSRSGLVIAGTWVSMVYH